MNENDIDFSPSDDSSQVTDYILNLDINIVIDQLMSQVSNFQSINTNNIDYLAIYKEKFKLASFFISKANPEALIDLLSQKMKIYEEIFTKYTSYYEIDETSFSTILNLKSSFDEFVEAMYYFFTFYRKENILNFLEKVIISNIKSFAERYKNDISKKDLSVFTKRKQFKKFEDVVILESLENICREIINDDFSNSEISSIEYMCKDNENDFYNAIILNNFKNIDILNFNRKYCSIFIDKSNMTNVISSEVLLNLLQNNLITKYFNKK